jgi:hypothetical protein
MECLVRRIVRTYDRDIPSGLEERLALKVSHGEWAKQGSGGWTTEWRFIPTTDKI